MRKDIKKAYKFYIEKTGKNITIEEFLNRINTLSPVKENPDKKDVMDNVSGGKINMKSDTATLIAALTIIMPNSIVESPSEYRNFLGFSSFSSVMAKEYIESENKEIADYISNGKISESEEKISEIIREYINQGLDIPEVLDKVSSYRYPDMQNLTEVEKTLDRAVRHGDLPIKSFTAKELDALKSKCIPKGNYSPTYVFVENDCDAIELQFYSKDGAIVQIASQFNALESVSPYFSPVKSWFSDKTQGPMASLQSISACKHRESAVLLGNLPDAIKDIVDSCSVKKRYGFLNLFKKNIPITEKYRNLYMGGYLNLYEIKEDNLEDLTTFAKHINQNKGNLKINSQWVRCEKTGHKQLQVFCAGPSFQGSSSISWNDNGNKRISAMKNICIDLVVEQYKAIAQISAIKSVLNGKQEELHLYMVGQGAFRNPPETMYSAIKAVSKELKGYDVKVYLHGGYLKSNNKWENVCESNEMKSLLGNKIYKENLFNKIY